LVGENDDGRFKFSAALSSLLFFVKTPCTREWRLQENLVRELVTITILFFFYFLDSPWHELRQEKLIKYFFTDIQVRDFKFMCPNDTVFDQENFICANWFEIDCRSSTFFYDKNLQLFQPNVESNKTNSGTSSLSAGTEEPSEQQKRQQEQQLKQLMVLEEQQAAQVLKQQQVIDQHERRQQEHQVYSTF
jgi:hypothetical protein